MGEVEAKELYLFIQNDGDLYRQQGLPIIQNLVQKIDRGVYDRTLAVKLYHYLAENGAKKYIKEYGGDKWFEMFDKPTRELVAKNFVADFEAEYKLGNYDQYHKNKKKYQGKAGMLKNPVGATRVTKKEFYAAGGFANSSYFRKMVSGRWQYYRRASVRNPPYGYGTHENPGKKIIYGIYSKGKFGLTKNKKSALDHVEKHGGQVRWAYDMPEFSSFDAPTFKEFSKVLDIKLQRVK
jgi:hypothetical protein